MSDEVAMDTAPITEDKTEVTRGNPKSGRWWKEEQTSRHSTTVVQAKPLKSSFQKKMAQKAKQQQVKLLQQEIRGKLAQEKQDKIQRTKEQEVRRLENEKKAEVVQVIKNMAKLKKIKKKHLRTIAKRDV